MIGSTSLVVANVYHKRHKPVEYAFSHKALFILLNLNQLEFLAKLKFFSLNKFNIFSLKWRDYGHQNFDTPKNYMLQILEKHNVDLQPIDQICLFTMPKVLGWGFNPVSFWLGFDNNELLYVVVAEVNNTFGERHSYICCYNHSKDGSISKYFKDKLFHVSPFCQVKGSYEFKFNITLDLVKININYYDEANDRLLTTMIVGARTPCNDFSLFKYFMVTPFASIKVIFWIHYHALRLWLKKVPYYRKPAQNKIDVS